MEITEKQARWESLATKIKDSIEDPDNYAHPYNLIIEGLWECERQVEERAQSRIADLERQVAAGEANVDTMHKAMTEARDDYHGRAVLFSSRYLDCLDREPTADVVRVTVGPGGILLTPAESVMTHGTDTAFEYVMRVEEGEYHLVRLNGVE